MSSDTPLRCLRCVIQCVQLARLFGAHTLKRLVLVTNTCLYSVFHARKECDADLFTSFYAYEKHIHSAGVRYEHLFRTVSSTFEKSVVQTWLLFLPSMRAKSARPSLRASSGVQLIVPEGRVLDSRVMSIAVNTSPPAKPVRKKATHAKLAEWSKANQGRCWSFFQRGFCVRPIGSFCAFAHV